MATIQWAGYAVEERIARMVDAAADRHGVPRNVLRAIVLAESEGRPDAINYEARGGVSVGLLQLYDGGQGAGMTVSERKDPERNLAVGTPHIRDAWRATAGLSPRRERVKRTAARSGHPGDVPSSDPRLERIAAIWDKLEAEDPTPESAATIAGVRVDLGRAEETVTRALEYARAHPLEAAGLALGAAVILLA